MQVRACRQNMGQIHITTVGYQDSVLHEGLHVWLLRSLRTTSFIIVLPRGRGDHGLLSGLAEGRSVGISAPCFDSVAQPQSQQSPVCWSNGIY